MHPERGRASVGFLFTLEIPVNNGGLEASSFREKQFGLEVSGKLWKRNVLCLPGYPSGWIGNFSDHHPLPRDPYALNRTFRALGRELESLWMFGS